MPELARSMRSLPLPDLSVRSVRVLELDPELAALIEEHEQEAAMAAGVAPLFAHHPGSWEFFPVPERGALGALILGGLVVIRTGTGGRTHVELLGEGDLISPWVSTAGDLNVPSGLSVEVITPMQIALLDRRFAIRTARWPEIQATLFQRLCIRSRRLGLQAAINAIPRVAERLDLTLWHLGDHFGRVGAEGIAIRLPFTHSLLAELTGAQRPSVTLAVKKLEAEGRLIRKARDQWILCGNPPSRFSPLARQTGLRA